MTSVQETLSTVGTATLEQLAFLFAVPEDEDRVISAEGCKGCRIPFSGHRSGQLLLVVSDPVLSELAVNMLGEEDGSDIAPQQIRDALCEAGNILCGNILPSVFGRDVVFDIGSPEAVDEADLGPLIGGLPGEGPLHRSSLLGLDEGECQIFLQAAVDSAGADG